ncbi:biosynthetic-type acetolactate synthase large subunit [candidate division KSB3 bacterium]|uniref:Acetolactate synthase n=1 Tax=candidate division KSB3 bacterium TaxID=2044937 RepID=A0A9D5JVT1_9BACT|nr:biosynthetic-type acetolactate synthase large subunit [candidate division KSB3 bacterium]MBD3324847.1 biosynthetic-type acetolactate synthase large subunit [candidate division KSB3 bacterium]
MKMTGARVLLECLKREGVDCVFGYPGAVILTVHDQMDELGIRYVLTRHEQGAVHAAVGYARATGKVGVCLATSGPGGTNLVTGITDAYMDSIPIVAFTGQVPRLMIGNDAFQEADIVGITRSVTKHNYLVQDVDEFSYIIRAAFHIAETGRPGPVLVDMPKDILMAETEFVYPQDIKIRGYSPNYYGNVKQIKRAAEAINQAERPVIYAGGGVISSGAAENLRELANIAHIPTTLTLMGLGAFPGNDPLFLGMLGMHGTQYANLAVTESDLLIAVGARFDDRVTGTVETFAPHAKIIHIDIDPSAISKNIKVDIPIVGDVKNVLVELNKLIEPRDHAAWLEQIAVWKREKPLTYQTSETTIKPQQVIETIASLTQGNAIITTEVGQHQMWAALFGTYHIPRSFISSGGLGVMGFGFPAAIGAQAGCPDKLVIDIAGDGSFQMVVQELATAVCEDFPVKVIILNNGFLGMIRQWQALFFEKRLCHSCLRHASGKYFPDFVKLADAYGAVGIRIDTPADLRPKLEEAFAIARPVIIDVIVNEDENVFPMVPAGAGISDMLLES